MIRTTILAAALAVALPAIAAEPMHHVLRTHDGDTLTTREDGTIRMLGLDAPEIGSRARCKAEDAMAHTARDYVASRVKAGVFLRTSLDPKGHKQANRDKYGRLLRKIISADDGDIGAELIERGLAVPYWGRGVRQDWCAVGAAK